MAGLETIKTLNATVRTGIATVVIGVLGFFGYQGYEQYRAPQLELERTQSALNQAQLDLEVKDQRIVDLSRENDEKSRLIERLATSIRLLKVNHRVAEIRVLEQTRRASDGLLVTRISFVETDDRGRPIGEPGVFEIEGDMVYVDYLIVKFEDKYIETAELDRATAICLFQRIFGENQEPSEGFELDEIGSRPTAYSRDGEMSLFEQQIWNDFWSLANDPQRAAELGIRAAHGNAASIRVQPGKRYQLKLRSTGEFTLRPMDAEPTS